MLLTQRIAHLLNGVSRKAATQRDSTQTDKQINGLSSSLHGLCKRPPLKHVGKLDSSTTGWADAHIHTITRDPTERYHIVVKNDTIKAFDGLTGNAVTVITDYVPGGYLNDPTAAGFKATTIGDETIIVNRGVTPLRGATKAAAPVNEAMIVVRQVDYSTNFTVTLDGRATTYRTADGTGAASRANLDTVGVATALRLRLLVDNFNLFRFNIEQFGSTLRITPKSAHLFTISTTDGLADKGIKAIMGKVQNLQELPLRAKNGTVLEIVGDPDSAKDNFWVKYSDVGLPNTDGVWEETVKPNTIVDFKASTMPHVMKRQGQALVNTPHQVGAALPLPAISSPASATSVATETWSLTVPGGAGLTPSLQQVRNEGEGVKAIFTTGLPTLSQLGVTITVDATAMEAGIIATATVLKNSTVLATVACSNAGPQPPPVDSLNPDGTVRPLTQEEMDLLNAQSTPPASNTQVVVLDFPAGLASNDFIVVRLNYSTGVTPSSDRRANVTILQSIMKTASLGTDVTYDATYPVGTVVTITLDATPFAHTVTGAPEAAAAVATALKTLVDASSSWVATLPTSKVVRITRQSGTTAFTTDVSVTLDTSTIFHNGDIALVTDVFVGLRLKNVTDGSTGTITSNAATTITVSSMTGGVDNKFQDGDVCTVLGTGRYFVFGTIDWRDRAAGDGIDVCPFPSFVDHTIDEVAFYRNRLVFCSGENVVLSAAGDVFNFFPNTATDLRDDDMIDVKSAHKEISLFHSAILWDDLLYLAADQELFVLDGQPLLTPASVTLSLAAHQANAKDFAPLVAGRNLIMAHGRERTTLVMEYTPSSNAAGTLESPVNLTEDVLDYLEGAPVAMAADAALGFLAVLTSGRSQESLYVYTWTDKVVNAGAPTVQRQRVQGSWSRWDFAPGTRIIQLDVIDGVLGVISMHSDGVYFGEVDLDLSLNILDGTTDISTENSGYLDRQIIAIDPTPNAASKTTSGTQFTDDFNSSGALSANWTKLTSLGSATITMVSNKAKSTPTETTAEGGYQANQATAQTECVVEADVTITAEFIGADIGCLDVTGDNGWLFRIIRNSAGAGHEITLLKRVSGINTPLQAVTSVTITFGQTYHLKLWVKNGQQKGYVDGTLRCSQTDTALNGTLMKPVIRKSTPGHNSGTYATWDNFVSYKGNTIRTLGMPTGWKVTIGATTVTESGGVATIDLAGTTLPLIGNLLVKDSASGLQYTLAQPSGGWWGGDIITFVQESGTILDLHGVTVVAAAGVTTFTLPYAVATDGSEGLLVIVNIGPNGRGFSVAPFATTKHFGYQGMAIQGDTLTRPTSTTAVYPEELNDNAWAIGILYEFRYKLSPIFYRGEGGVPNDDVRLQLRYLDVTYDSTHQLRVDVTPEGRPLVSTEIAGPFATGGTPTHVELKAGILHLSVLARSDTVLIELVNDSPGGCRISTAAWEGNYVPRSRTV